MDSMPLSTWKAPHAGGSNGTINIKKSTLWEPQTLNLSVHQRWCTSLGNVWPLLPCTWVALHGPRSVGRYCPWADSRGGTSPGLCAAWWPAPHVHLRMADGWRRGGPCPNIAFQIHGQWPSARNVRCPPPCHGPPNIWCKVAPAAHSCQRSVDPQWQMDGSWCCATDPSACRSLTWSCSCETRPLSGAWLLMRVPRSKAMRLCTTIR